MRQRAQIEVAMPKKRGAASVKGHADAEARFLQRTAAAVRQHVDFAVVRCLLLAGPGFARDKLRSYLLSGAGGDAALWQRHKEAIISVPASTAYLQAIPVRAGAACVVAVDGSSLISCAMGLCHNRDPSSLRTLLQVQCL